MRTYSAFILWLVKLFFWTIFIGLCIKTGALVVSTAVSLFVNPAATADLYMGLDLSTVWERSQQVFLLYSSTYILLNALQAYIGYLIVSIILKLKADRPFSPEIALTIEKVSQTSLIAGITAIFGHGISRWLLQEGIHTPIEWAYTEILFFGGVVYFIAEVFRRGVVFQQENELTV